MYCKRRTQALRLAALLVLLPAAVSAQFDTEVKPHVIFALDTSGSMLQKPGVCKCVTPSCAECVPNCTTEFDTRWDAVTQALIGSFRNDGTTYRRSCTRTDRKDPAVYPYDVGYALPDVQPSVVDSASVPVDYALWREQTGVMQIHKDRFGFGLITMDTQPTEPKYPPSVPSGPSFAGAEAMFSYGTETPFSFPACAAPPHVWNLGMRDGRIAYTATSNATNGWTYDVPATAVYGRLGVEGRYVSPNASNWYEEVTGRWGPDQGTWCTNDSQCTITNTRCNTGAGRCYTYIEGALEGVRPYGGSPTAALFADAKDMLTADPAMNLDPQLGCRKRIMILITDGAANFDARGYPYYCESGGGSAGEDGDCPYLRPEDYVDDIIAAGSLDAVFVIGLDVDPAATDDASVDARAVLEAISTAGTTPLFSTSADLLGAFPELDPGSGTYYGYLPAKHANLQATIERILDIFPPPVSSRSVPTFANVLSESGRTQAQFNTGYTVSGERSGVLERVRYVCDASFNPVPTFEGEEAGVNRDDFDALVDEQGQADNRSVWTATPTASPTRRQSIGLPAVSLATDLGGIGNDTTRQPCLERPCTDAATSVQVDTLTPQDFGLTAAQGAERDQTVEWVYGTCDRSVPGATCPAIKDIFGSSPVFVTGRTTATAADPAHALFTFGLDRPDTLYVNDNGGSIHMIIANDWDGDQNGVLMTTETAGYEMGAYVPPMLLEDTKNRALGGAAPVLRATPVVKDINVFQRIGDAPTGNEYKTVLLSGANSGRDDGYVALDVTNPHLPGEKFLWQFKTLEMGRTEGRPALGQVRLQDPDNNYYTRGIAILPGGAAFASLGETDLADVHATSRVGGSGGINAVAVSGTPATPYVDWDVGGTLRIENGTRPFWPHGQGSLNDGRTGRGVWIVDVGSGRTIRKFGLNENPGCYGHNFGTAPAHSTWNGLDLTDESHTDLTVCPHSPFTGTVSLYPGVPGTLAQAAYVVDADGILWRIDLATPDETTWRMEPFFDLFNLDTGGAEDNLDGDPDGTLKPMPVVGAPILSVNEVGEVVIIIGTGDVDNLSATGVTNRIVSLTEKLTWNGTRYVPTARVNWQMNLENEHITGPMTLADGIVYYTTFENAPTGSACGVGYGRICGAHYLTRAKEADPTYTSSTFLSGALDPQKVFSDGTVPVYCTIEQENQVFGGVAVTRRPTCIDDTSPDTIDPYFCPDGTTPIGTGSCDKTPKPTNISGGETEIVAIGSSGGTTAVPKSSISQATSGSAREDRQVTVLSWSGTAY